MEHGVLRKEDYEHERPIRRSSGIFPIRAPLAGVRCLVVEDEPTVAHATARMLKGFGGRPFVVGTVKEALDALTKRRWDLILVDLRLPDGNGEDVVRTAKRLRPKPAVVVASGMLDSVSRIRLQLHGALVADKVEFSTHFLALSLEALRRARSTRRRTSCTNESAIEGEAMPQTLSPDVPVQRPSRPVGESSARDCALAEFGARFRFSPKEQQTFVLSIRGFTDKEIAGCLGVAHGTVRTNWVRMAKKIGGAGGEREVLKHFARWCADEAE